MASRPRVVLRGRRFSVSVPPNESGIPDVDTAVVTMKMANGCIAVINDSRQAVHGYDQTA